jgi:hypothetical protein
VEKIPSPFSSAICVYNTVISQTWRVCDLKILTQPESEMGSRRGNIIFIEVKLTDEEQIRFK